MAIFDRVRDGAAEPLYGAPDLVIIHPGAAHGIYGALADEVTAIEPPLWARLIAGYVLDRGFQVRIIDAEADRKSPTEIALDIFARSPRLVCIAAYGHQPSASTQQMDEVYEIAKAVRSVSAARIVVVGGHVSALPELTLRECQAIDYVCVGEGPRTIVSLLEGHPPESVPGLARRHRIVDVCVNERAPLIEDLSDLHGDVWDLLPMGKYRAHNWQCLDDLDARQPYASIYTSLGCPYKCAFCCINAPFASHRYRMRVPEEVVDEILTLREQHGVRTFKITDEMFVLNERHYGEICTRLAPHGEDINIWAYSRVDTVKADKLAMLRKAGVKWLALGIESESAYVRNGVDKRLKRDDIADVVKAIQSAGINVIANYIFGLPDDDLDSMRSTLQLAMDLCTEWANFYSCQAYPGSPLYDDAVKKGWNLPATWSGYSQHGYETRPLDTRKIDAASVLKFRDDAFSIYFNSPRFLEDTEKKFGTRAVNHIRHMARREMPRRLINDTYAPRERASAQ